MSAEVDRVEMLHSSALVKAFGWLWLLFLTSIFLFDHRWTISQGFAGDIARLTADELAQEAGEGTPIRRMAFLALGAVSALSLYWGRGRFHNIRISKLGWLVLLFLGWATASTAWSVEPAMTTRRLSVFLILWFAAFATSLRFGVRVMVLGLLLSSLAYLHMGIAAEIVLGTFHPLDAGYRFAGTLHPNSQAGNCALLLLAALFLARFETRWRGAYATVALEAILFLYLTKSRTSLGAVLLSLTAAYFLLSSTNRQRFLVLGSGIALCLVVMFSDLIAPTFARVGTLGRQDSENVSLTGRIPLWGQAYSYIRDRPVQGYGYGAFWTPRHIVDFSAKQGWIVPDAHSAIVDACLSIGIVGCGMYLAIMAWSIGGALTKRTTAERGYYACLGVALMFAVIAGITESVIFDATPLTLVFMLVVCLLSVSERRRRRVQDHLAEWQDALRPAFPPVRARR